MCQLDKNGPVTETKIWHYLTRLPWPSRRELMVVILTYFSEKI